MSRGNDAIAIFRDDDDRTLFLDLLAQEIGRSGAVLHQYCLLTRPYFRAATGTCFYSGAVFEHDRHIAVQPHRTSLHELPNRESDSLVHLAAGPLESEESPRLPNQFIDRGAHVIPEDMEDGVAHFLEWDLLNVSSSRAGLVHQSVDQIPVELPSEILEDALTG